MTWHDWTTKYLGPDARSHTFTGLTATNYQVRVVAREQKGANLSVVSVSFEQDEYRATEGGTATVKVQLSAAPGREVKVPITALKQGGAADADYSGVPDSVTFAANETEKSFTFTAASDTDDDDGESVKLVVYDLPRRVTGNAATTIHIDDDDGDPFLDDGNRWSNLYTQEVTVASTKSGNPTAVSSANVETPSSGVLHVRWPAVDAGAGSEVYAYSVRIREAGSNSWRETRTVYDYIGYPVCYTGNCGGSKRQVSFGGLRSGRDYEIEIQSHNANGSSAWTSVGTHRPR